MDDETENISPHSQKGRNCVHNTGFTLTGVLISVHETGLGVFSVSTKWDWGQILCPHLWVHYIPSELNRINTPIVAICGLSPMTQKFDLQLYFRDYFMKDGYKVSQIGTRDMGYLFGFHSWGDALYTNCFSETEKIAKINQFVKDIELVENPDIFIIGIPDALIPYTQKHTFRYGIPAFEILNAITPDYMVMSLFNGEYTDEFYEEMIKMCNYKYNADVDCFFNSHFVPISRSINSDHLSYSYGNRLTAKSEKYSVFNSESIDDRDMYECVVNKLVNYGKFKAY